MAEICNKNPVVVVNRLIKLAVHQEEIKCLHRFNHVSTVLILALCKAGSYSPTGMEPCFPCEKGYYQEFEGQSQCTKCNANKTTSGRGSNSTIQCKGIGFQDRTLYDLKVALLIYQ